MTGFLLTLIAVLLAGLGARDQVAMAGLVQRQGARPGLLLTGVAVSIASAAFAAWAATAIAPLLNGNARLFFAALALGFAGAELLLLSPGRKPEEPTLSLGAAGIVLLAHQITDAARFLVFAIAVATNASVSAGMGGAVGGIAVIAAGWLVPDVMTGKPLRRVRRGVGAAFLLLALYLGFGVLSRG